MKKKMIGQMLAGMDEKYIQEAIEAEKTGASGKRPAMKMRKLAAAAAVGVIVQIGRASCRERV